MEIAVSPTEQVTNRRRRNLSLIPEDDRSSRGGIIRPIATVHQGKTAVRPRFAIQIVDAHRNEVDADVSLAIERLGDRTSLVPTTVVPLPRTGLLVIAAEQFFCLEIEFGTEPGETARHSAGLGD